MSATPMNSLVTEPTPLAPTIPHQRPTATDSVADLWNALRGGTGGRQVAIWEAGCYQRAMDGMGPTISRTAYALTALGVLAHLAALALGHLQGIGWTVAPMLLFLALSLLPSIWTPEALSGLVKARRDFVACAVIWGILHGYLASGAVLAQQPEGWTAHWGGPEILMGVAGLVMLGGFLLLAQRRATAQRATRGRLGLLLWPVPTLAFVHGWLASLHYADQAIPSSLLMLGLAATVATPAVAYLMGHNMRINLLRLTALVVGTGIALGVIMLVAPVGVPMVVMN